MNYNKLQNTIFELEKITQEYEAQLLEKIMEHSQLLKEYELLVDDQEKLSNNYQNLKNKYQLEKTQWEEEMNEINPDQITVDIGKFNKELKIYYDQIQKEEDLLNYIQQEREEKEKYIEMCMGFRSQITNMVEELEEEDLNNQEREQQWEDYCQYLEQENLQKDEETSQMHLEIKQLKEELKMEKLQRIEIEDLHSEYVM